jgi:CubicO group peptidase (beta-lactamase class C family)/D-alanyl-D-alanine dipeptidase
MRIGTIGFSLALCLLCLGQAQAQPLIEPAKPYAELAKALSTFLEQEIEQKKIPAISIALVDDQTIVWARGFGVAKLKEKTPATAETVYRVGSVSKLFTDIGIMQLVEQGILDLDAPVTRYLPDFKPTNPFNKPITLRQMMAHRSGLVREPPIGHYFDAGNVTLEETVKSLNDTELVYAPETHTKYSNAAIATVGLVVEKTRKEPFPAYLKRAVLDPLGLKKSSFEATPGATKELADAIMWTYHGREFAAPTFQLGMAPAGSMYSTVIDLGRFMSVLFAGGKGPGGQVLKRETIDKMWSPQFAKEGEKYGFGIGFMLGDLEGKRRVGHSGAMYGFATELAALPDEKLAVAVVASKDCANPVVERIANVALARMLAVRAGKPLEKIEMSKPVSLAEARKLTGRYELDGVTSDWSESMGRLYSLVSRGGTRSEWRQAGDALIADGELRHGTIIKPKDGALLLGKDEWKRVSVPKPEPSPTRWAGLIGEYGWDHNTLFILERDGKLQALIEWFFLYPLTEVAENVYKFPEWGLYQDEKLIFTRDASGRATEVNAASIVFKRRKIDGENGETFKIKAEHPIAELRRAALAAKPPHEAGDFRKPDLVDLTTLDKTIKLDIRYATTNNFLSTPLYQSARAYMQRSAAEAVVKAHRQLADKGYGLLIFDGYRPWSVTKMFWDATPEKFHMFVADPEKGSRHNRGCAVDLTLYDLKTGKPIDMVGGYDEMSDRSYPDYLGGTSLQRWHRDLLRRTMEANDFSVYEAEWWHYDYKDWRSYPILNLTFEELAK